MVRDTLGARSTVPLFFVATALYWASMYVYMPILPVHAENLGASMGLVGTIVGAYGFSQLVLRIPLGIWSDRIGVRKPFILAGLAAAALGALGLGLSSDPLWLVVWRAMSGVGAAAWVAFTVLFSSYFAPQKATRAMAYLTFVGFASQTVSTYAGGVVAQTWGWHAPFYVAMALGVLGTVAALPISEKALPIRREMTLREIYRIGTVPLLVVVSLTAMLSMWTHWATSGGFSLVYAGRLGASRADLGTLTMVMQVALTATTLLSAFLAERIGARATAIAGLGMQAIGAFAVPLVDTIPLVGITQALSGAGRGLAYPLMMGLSIRAVPAGDRATAMGVFQAVYALGMFAGPASTGVIGDGFGLGAVFAVAGMASLLGVAVVAAGVPGRGN
ncbi:MAG: MFS transporter [Chloroflexota bacterium]